jgi:asparagine synthase (glutamine-hydrolysing)
MCGIVGYLSFTKSNQPVDSLLKNMAKDIHHRGPDDEGYHINDWVGLGFKRLSILDVSSKGHQPMVDESQNYIITMNGEIYNFKDLREQLNAKGYTFRSQTDTEVVLNGYKEWGTGVFENLQGMFAIIIHDKVKDEVVVARDQLGIKPMYYHLNNEFALFGSEIKSFRHKMDFQVNTDKLYEQFIYGYVGGEPTIFKDVYRILPGTYHVFKSNGRINICEYYDITKQVYTGNYKTFSDEEIRLKLKESILQHTISDVGYNIQLSGGVDSSYVTAVLANDYNQDLHTYSITLSGYEKDESEYQQLVAKQFGTHHHAFDVGAADLFGNYEKATWHHDIPMVHPASVFLMVLCEHSRQHSKVILTGEGADELFSGYSRYQIDKRYELYSRLAKYPGLVKAFPGVSKFKGLKKYLLNTEFGIDEAVYFSIEKELGLLNKPEKDLTYRKSVIGEFDSLIHKMIASDQTSYLNWLFERQDKMSMAMSVESRVPFSNHLLFNMMNTVNPQDKIKPMPKSILKRIAGEYFNDDFVYRRKNGFVLPYDKWMKEENGLKPWFDLLTDSTFKNRGYYNVPKVEKMIKELLNDGINHSKYLMTIINFEIWHRQFIDN